MSQLSKYPIRIILVALVIALSALTFYTRKPSTPFGVNSISAMPEVDKSISMLGLKEPPSGTQGLNELRLSSLSEFGLEVNSYEMSPKIWERVDGKCIWSEQGGYYKKGMALINPLFFVYPKFLKIVSGVEENPLKVDPQISSFVYKASLGRFELTLNMSSILKDPDHNPFKVMFVPVTFNAADLGFKALRLNLTNSSNVEVLNTPNSTQNVFINIAAFACLPPLNPEVQGINQIIVTNAVPPALFSKLPARASYDLWNEIPSNMQNPEIEPNLKFDLIFK